jgi:putative ABC transport system substrate-binding protein
MHRRDFIACLGGFASAWPVVALAQKSGIRQIGALMPVAAEDPNGRDRVVVFGQALQERGWTEGRNVRIDLRWAPNEALLRKFATELAALAPDVILASGGKSIVHLQSATRTVPIVFAGAIDPVSFGFVASLARPGGNTTGFIDIEYGFSVKWLELLKQIAPTVRRAGVLRSGMDIVGSAQFDVINAAAPAMQMETTSIDMDDARALERSIAAFAAEPDGGLIVTASNVATARSELIVALAARYGLPAVYPNRLHVVAGGLISYGSVFLDQFRRAADYVDRILRGAKPADLPVQAPTRYEMALNLRAAKDLGLNVPRSVLARATEVID